MLQSNTPSLGTATVPIADYAMQVAPTDLLPAAEMRPAVLGLFGEVGSVLTTVKKPSREGAAYTDYEHDVTEEFGDTLWYLAAVCRRAGFKLDEIIADASLEDGHSTMVVANDRRDGPVAHVPLPKLPPAFGDALTRLGEAAAKILAAKSVGNAERPLVVEFARAYLLAVHISGIPFAHIAQSNIAKTTGAFLEPDFEKLPLFDDNFIAAERLPDKFEISVSIRTSGQSYLQWNGVFIGDPLTDNIAEPDGYRFHDVFHFANAAILHWSPVMRALIKHKRKSDKYIDETQDSGRAIVIEEGVTAWIFSRAKRLQFFENEKVPFDILKTISQFVRGYEVDRCPLKLWERAILQGYAAFRQLRDNQGGIIVGDRKARTLEYRRIGT